MALNDWIITNEAMIRLTGFFCVFITMALWEHFIPCRPLQYSKWQRWFNNLALILINNLMLRLVAPAAAVGVAVFAELQGWGMFNFYQVSFLFAVFISVVLLDLAIYLQHVMVHSVPLFWRLHRVHHADPDFDLTTGSRFHPFEILLSFGIKMTAIILIGPPVIAVVIFEVLLNLSAMFNHSNVSLPAKLDQLVRLIWVTPDMHRIHHSVEDHETNSNFGFALSWWDRVFGTYKDQPDLTQQTMKIGIHGFESEREIIWLPGMLRIPLKPMGQGYTLNRRNWIK